MMGRNGGCHEKVHADNSEIHGMRRGAAGEFAVSALEAFCNAAVGLIVSWAATFFVLGYSASGSAAVTAMFFGLSFTRSYALRLIFRRFG